MRNANAELTTQLQQQGLTLAGLREALDSQVHVIQVLSGPHTITAQLAPKGDGRASGRVLVDAATGDVALVAADLATLAPGKAYELWAIRGDRPPEPAGVWSLRMSLLHGTKAPYFPSEDPRFLLTSNLRPAPSNSMTPL